MVFEYIRLVARYERRLIIRNKLFWIFAICVVGGIACMQWGWQGQRLGGWHWTDRALPSFIPFLNAWVYNLVQGIVVIFIGIDFVWRDRRLETNVVFSARPVSNLAYQAGKVLGIIEVCLLLNVLTMGAGMLIHLLFGELGTFQLRLYLIYMLVVTLPTLFFVLGIALVIANRVRNHAVAILLLLGIFAAFYFGASGLFWGVADPWGRNLPLLFSDVTGLSRPLWIVLQRGAFFVCGTGLILLSMGMMKRLSERVGTIRVMQVVGVICVLLGFVLGYGYFDKFQEINARRNVYRAVFEKYESGRGCHVKTHDIYFQQTGERVTGESCLEVANTSNTPLERLLFYLNPGLEVTALTDGQGNGVAYNREEQVVHVEKGLQPGEEIVLRMTYEGVIDEAVCYPELTDEEFHDTRLMNFFRVYHQVFRHGGNYARVGDDYTLLFPECLWYPVSEPPANINVPLSHRYDFTLYSLKVGNVGERVVISQGEADRRGDTVVFKNQERLPRLSLSIGNYERRNVVVDSLQLELFYFPGHDFFLEDYTTTGDSLTLLVQEPVGHIRAMRDSDYPYRKFTVVETPVNFIPYQRKGVEGSGFVQPEILFYPERMYLGYYSHVEYWPGEEDDRNRFELERDGFENLLMVNLSTGPFDCSVMFDDFGGILQSDEYPGFGRVANDLSRVNLGVKPRVYLGDEIEYPEIVAYWEKKSLRDALEDNETKYHHLRILLDWKFAQIEKHLQALVGERELFEFAKGFKKRYLHSGPDFQVFEREFNEHFKLNLREILDCYYDMKELPVLFVRDMQIELHGGEDEEEYISSCKVYNPSSVPAVVTLEVNTYSMGDGEYGSGKRSFLIPPHGCKEIRNKLDDPEYFFIEMNLCQNIPGESRMQFSPKSLSRTEDGRTGVWDTDSSVFTRKEPGIVVDNGDEGFVIHEKKRREKLAAYFSKQTDTRKYNYIYDHERWTLVTEAKCYGDIVKSAYYKVAGNGKTKVEWKAKIDKPGRYEVFAYIPEVETTPARTSFVRGARLYYQIGSSEGMIDVEVSPDSEELGWVSLGKYDFDAGEYSVFLSDKGGDSLIFEKNEDYAWESEAVQLIFADAVKWVPVRN
ncbi:golvesin C-terminal-like domain-containing protein [Butyricimonas paravirosa]|uniref:golvesin C-terminal-like domain-containing protein n=1 Tax=Butyricimonas paravirosa TaxID=1472417 RepID=UPI002108D8F5|nr:hypothetical protein [Butyricimonas paravirosa]MCQ4872644.1 hypothetical protein [Butyricimonas paravirosa]